MDYFKHWQPFRLFIYLLRGYYILIIKFPVKIDYILYNQSCNNNVLSLLLLYYDFTIPSLSLHYDFTTTWLFEENRQYKWEKNPINYRDKTLQVRSPSNSITP